MDLELLRYSSQKGSTLGLLMKADNVRKFMCYTLEDEWRTEKVYGETRIPSGRYEIKLRTFGGFHKDYKDRFSNLHKGMLWLQDVENFTNVLIHIGNNDEDTAGCILVGDTASQNATRDGFIGRSTNAYKRIYPPIAQALSEGERVFIRIRNLDTL